MKKEKLLLKIIGTLSFVYGLYILITNYRSMLFMFLNLGEYVKEFGLIFSLLNGLVVFILPILFVIGSVALFMSKAWGKILVIACAFIIILVDFYGLFISFYTTKKIHPRLDDTGDVVVIVKSLVFQHITTAVIAACAIYLIVNVVEND